MQIFFSIIKSNSDLYLASDYLFNLPTWLHQGPRLSIVSIEDQAMTHLNHFIIEEIQWKLITHRDLKNKSLYEFINRKTMRSQRNIFRRLSSFGTSKAPPTTPVPGKMKLTSLKVDDLSSKMDGRRPTYGFHSVRFSPHLYFNGWNSHPYFTRI